MGHRTYYRPTKGRGKLVVLLHGGLSSSRSLWRSIGPHLREHFSVSAFDRRGHGRTADTDAPFSIDAMVDETIAFVEFLGERAHLVGHSDGANVALGVARRRPDLVRRVVAVGGNFHYHGLMPLEVFTPQSPTFCEFAVSYARLSPDGIAHAAVVVEKSRHLVENEPTWSVHDLGEIRRPVLIMAGDDDVATLNHTTTMYESLRHAQLAIVPGASHSVLSERPGLSSRIIVEYLRGPAHPVTRAPVRRGSKT